MRRKAARPPSMADQDNHGREVWPEAAQRASLAFALFRLARPHFLLGAALFYGIGALIARRETGALRPGPLALGLALVWLVQLTTHFTNEYHDRQTDRRNPHRTPFSGGSGVLARGELPDAAALWCGGAAFVLSLAFLAWASRLPTFSAGTLALFTLALIGAVGYSVPPLSFASRGWGDLTTTVVVALLVPQFGHHMQTGRMSVTPVLTCLPFVPLILANMLIVAFPDHAVDQTAGKRTLVVAMGPHRAARVYSALIVIGYATAWLTLGWGLPAGGWAPLTLALPVAGLSLHEMWSGGYRRPGRFLRNTTLGVSAVASIPLAELAAFLLFG